MYSDIIVAKLSAILLCILCLTPVLCWPCKILSCARSGRSILQGSLRQPRAGRLLAAAGRQDRPYSAVASNTPPQSMQSALIPSVRLGNKL